MSDKAFMIMGGVIGFAAWMYLIIKYHIVGPPGWMEAGGNSVFGLACVGAGVAFGYIAIGLLRAIGQH